MMNLHSSWRNNSRKKGRNRLGLPCGV